MPEQNQPDSIRPIDPNIENEEVATKRLRALKTGAVNDAVREIVLENRIEIIKRASAKLKRFNVEVSDEDTLGI